jgi:hypothetical protein
MKRTVLVFCILLSAGAARSQTESRERAPGPDVSTGFLSFWMGGTWQSVWQSVLSVPMLDLNSYSAVDEFVDTVSAYHTSALKLKLPNGKQFIYHPLHTSIYEVLPPRIRKYHSERTGKAFVADVNPLSPLVYMKLAEVFDLPSANIHFVMMPDNDRLGDHQSRFGGTVGFIEEYQPLPSISSEELLDKLNRMTSISIDAAAYIKQKLLEEILLPFNAGPYRLRWIRLKNNGTEGYKPECRPLALPFYNIGFDDNVSDRYLDERLLAGISRNVWDITAESMKSDLTDEIIEEIIASLPQPLLPKDSARMLAVLKSGRDNMQKLSEKLYRRLACVVDITASERSEYAEINRIGNDSLEVTLYRRDDGSGNKTGDRIYHRTFTSNETKEVRLHLKEGDDFAKISGASEGSIMIRIVGGDGSDELVDSSIVRGYLWSILPIKTDKIRAVFYDTGDRSQFVYGPSAAMNDAEFHLPDDDTLMYAPKYLDKGNASYLFYNIDLASELVKGGARYLIENYAFRSIPYKNVWYLSGNVGAANDKIIRGRAETGIIMPNVLHGTLAFDASYSSLNVINFFGLGNESHYDSKRYDTAAYAMVVPEFRLGGSYQYDLPKDIRLGASGAFRYAEPRTNMITDSITSSSKFPLGTGKASTLQFGLSGEYDTRNSNNYPERGLYARIANMWTPEVLDNRFSYTKASADIRYYTTVNWLRGITLALNARAEKIWGEFPFYDAAYLGGDVLRGFSYQRFGGDASILGAAELRVALGRYDLIISRLYGFLVGAETGKVFYKKTDASTLHTSINWGLWTSSVVKDMVITLTAASSQERTNFRLGLGFSF